ncbi:MAG: valine--tRNA ligase [Candidatus Altiarchaeum hamiconexum]|uniref:Valine--tRNA ligase n=1 Tax=Candidatus Altarchaeum hamiconexum TaxID=1803513 RepID=A0A8J7YZ00_9ARCH|nr:valine--tRNA ligase [Candidatus Altarchaeum hamiconexum]NCS91546.1 valine--tRNA ligase [Candidatus Altarchaeum hamiconexum]NCT00683.1 valine--tRNA ligase [Candidatus Altarchaeum hamiconexum]OIQ05164.1 MAG: valine--tRNA ligase [Candidatus Altarchaeum sp. CG2_30_32_3053]
MLPKDYNFLEIEKKWHNEWLSGKYSEIFKFNEGDNDSEVYVIDTPPPFTSGKLHMGHVLNFIWIDIIARFKRMKNFNVLCPQGWDTQGLPTELKVEQKYKIKKNEREKFRNLCIEWTKEFIANMKSQMTMIGYIPDWSREYKTMDPNYWKAVQYSLIKFYEKGMIYKDKHPVHFCPSCGTAIAKAEIEYITRETTLNFIKFYLDEKSNEGNENDNEKNENFIIIATTRPELIQACVAVFVHPNDERYKHLIGKFVNVPLTDRKVKIIAENEVDINFGTGIVMICSFGDEHDVKWIYKYNLEIINAINEYGKLADLCGIYKGMKVEEARKKIIEDLNAKKSIVQQEKLNQNVGIHERCKKPVEFISTDQWFIKVIDSNDRLMEESRTIKWIPDYMQKRFKEWVENMDWDWVISRQRIFGTPIPFYYCEHCSKIIPAEIFELPIDPTLKEKKCPHCSNILSPAKDVCDCWVDSSITPLIVSKWLNDEKYFNKTYPVSLRPQGHEIIRTWAFYTLFRCLILTDKIPFSNILVNGMVFGKDGKKMSKSLGNVVEPNEIIEKYGADAVRQWACTFVPGSDTSLIMKDIDYGKRFITKLWNAARFIEMNLQDYKHENNHDEIFGKNLTPVDKWILAKCDEMTEKTDAALENFNFAVMKDLQNFVWHDVCDNYLELVKYRMYENLNRQAAQYTLHIVLTNLMRQLAPFIPHTTEEIEQNFNKNSDSVHSKGNFPKPLGIDKKYLDVENVVAIIEAIRKFKGDNKIKLSEEISRVKIYRKQDAAETKFIEECIIDIKKAGRAKEAEIFDSDVFKVECEK